MKKFSFYLSLVALVILSSCSKEGSNSDANGTVALNNANDSLSYALGVAIGTSFNQQGMDSLNYTLFSRSTQDAFGNEDLLMTLDDANKFINNYMGKLSAGAASKNLEEGKAFLADNATKDGVVTLPDGLQYKILTKGNGPKPGPTSSVTVNYHGTLIDGTVFDSSVERGEPATFQVNQVIQGWQEALQLMPVGSKWKLFVPSNLAYGNQGAGPTIKPGSTLIFEVELISIN